MHVVLKVYQYFTYEINILILKIASFFINVLETKCSASCIIGKNIWKIQKYRTEFEEWLTLGES